MHDASTILMGLVRLEPPLPMLFTEVAALPLIEAPCVEINAVHVVRVLERFLADALSGEDVGRWADELESLVVIGTVSVSPPHEDLVADVLRDMSFEYAIEGRVWEHHADDHLQRLRGDGVSP